MKMKYIIELEDEPFGRNDDPNIPHGMDELWRVKGFNSLVFDKAGLDRLKPLDVVIEEFEAKAYQRGYENGFAEGRKRTELSEALIMENKRYDETKQIIKDFLCGKSHDMVQCLKALETAKEILGEGCTVTDIDRWINER